MQQTLPRLFQDNQITQRTADGYIHATKMCQANGKKLNDYTRLESTTAYLQELGGLTGIPADLLIHKITSGPNELRGTWIHPQAAIHLAMWCSPAFAVAVTAWVVEWMSGHAPQLSQANSLPSYQPVISLADTATISQNTDAFSLSLQEFIKSQPLPMWLEMLAERLDIGDDEHALAIGVFSHYVTPIDDWQVSRSLRHIRALLLAAGQNPAILPDAIEAANELRQTIKSAQLSPPPGLPLALGQAAVARLIAQVNDIEEYIQNALGHLPV